MTPPAFLAALLSPLPPAPDLPLYAVFLLIPLLGGCLSFLSSDCSRGSRAWRASLRKSSLSLPTLVVAPVWVLLYLCMGHASYRAFQADPRDYALASSLVAYLTHLLLNHFSIIVLFGLQRIDLALLMAFPLWLSTLATTLLFYDVDRHAASLMLPVLLWVSYNFYLNLFLFMHNPVYTELDLAHGYPRPTQTPEKQEKLQ